MSCTSEWAEHVCSHGPLEHWDHGTVQRCRIIIIPNMDHEFESNQYMGTRILLCLCVFCRPASIH
jgi:hypothetical protein